MPTIVSSPSKQYPSGGDHTPAYITQYSEISTVRPALGEYSSPHLERAPH